MFLLPWTPKRGAFMAKGRHSRGRHKGLGGQLPQTAPLDPPLYPNVATAKNWTCPGDLLIHLFTGKPWLCTQQYHFQMHSKIVESTVLAQLSRWTSYHSAIRRYHRNQKFTFT